MSQCAGALGTGKDIKQVEKVKKVEYVELLILVGAASRPLDGYPENESAGCCEGS